LFVIVIITCIEKVILMLMLILFLYCFIPFLICKFIIHFAVVSTEWIFAKVFWKIWKSYIFLAKFATIKSSLRNIFKISNFVSWYENKE